MKKKVGVILLVLLIALGIGWMSVQFPEIEETSTESAYCIPDSSLVIESLKNYTGAYVEDGTDEPVSGIASIVVKNTGNMEIEYAQINIYGKRQTLQFELAGLPSEGKMLVLEKNKQSVDRVTDYTADALVAEVEKFDKSREKIWIKELAENSITVQNISDSDFETVRIFYKNYNEAERMYMGGIAYTAKITDFKQGQEITIYPSHYKKSESKVIMVRVYNELEE